MTIDGTSQPGYYGQAAINPNAPPPLILINGNGAVGNGLTLAAGSSGSTIKGIGIFGFVGDNLTGVAGAASISSRATTPSRPTGSACMRPTAPA